MVVVLARKPRIKIDTAFHPVSLTWVVQS
jgi:hypothetical protein